MHTYIHIHIRAYIYIYTHISRYVGVLPQLQQQQSHANTTLWRRHSLSRARTLASPVWAVQRLRMRTAHDKDYTSTAPPQENTRRHRVLADATLLHLLPPQLVGTYFGSSREHSPHVYWSEAATFFDVLFFLHWGHLLQNVGVHFSHNHVSSSFTV